MKRQRVDLSEAYAHCCRICPLDFFIAFEIKNNIKFQCANARIRSGVWLERRVAASLVSQRHPQRLADGLYPTTCVPTILRKHQRCLTYTTTTAWSTKRVLRRDRSKIIKLKMLYILHNKNWGVLVIDKWDTAEHCHKRSCDFRNWTVSRPSSSFGTDPA